MFSLYFFKQNKENEMQNIIKSSLEASYGWKQEKCQIIQSWNAQNNHHFVILHIFNKVWK